MSTTRRARTGLALAFALLLLVSVLPTVTGCSGGQNQDQDQGGEDTQTPTEMTVKLYFVSAGENALGIERSVPYADAAGSTAIEALIAGPTDAELTTWPALGTAIPESTELLGLTIEDGVATVDFSAEFENGGGTFSVTSRLAQVVYTLCEFDTVDSVEFYIDGEPVTVFSSEGLELDGPQTPEDYYELLPIDA